MSTIGGYLSRQLSSTQQLNVLIRGGVHRRIRKYGGVTWRITEGLLKHSPSNTTIKQWDQGGMKGADEWVEGFSLKRKEGCEMADNLDSKKILSFSLVQLNTPGKHFRLVCSHFSLKHVNLQNASIKQTRTWVAWQKISQHLLACILKETEQSFSYSEKCNPHRWQRYLG